jgi:hypothetical protein
MSTDNYEELDGNIITSITGPLATSSLSNKNAKSAHAHLLRSSPASRKMAVTDMSFRHRAVIEFLVKRGKLGRSHLRATSWCVWRCLHGVSSVRRWVKHFKDGNTDIADQPRCGQPRTAATERNKQNVEELIRQGRMITEKLHSSLEWGTVRSRG